MRRRSERKKSTEVLSPPAVVKRPGRRSHRSTSQVETRKGNKTEDAKINNEVVNNETKQQCSSTNEKPDDGGDTKPRTSVSSPQVDVELKKTPAVEPELETIPEAPAENSAENSSEACSNDTKATTNHKEESTESEKTAENNDVVVAAVVTTEPIQQNSTEKSPVKKTPEEPNDPPKEEENNSNNKKEESPPAREEPMEANGVEVTSSEVSAHAKQAAIEQQDKTDSPEKSDNPPAAAAAVEGKKTFNRSRERRAQQQATKIKEELENDENAEFNNKSSQQKNSTFFSTPSNEKTQNTRKRRWLSKRSSDTSSQILAISTDSLKNLISDVHPVPLCDVKLESSSDVEEVESEREDGEASPTPYKPRTEKTSIFDRERKPSKNYDQPTRKISVLNDGYESAQPVPPRNASSCILYITNLVRPFTILQLKGLLARTGKIVENRFWIDKIKSKCYVQYETEDEAVETRHALHGVRWPTSNPKCLNVDFGTAADMEKAMASTQDSGPQFGQETGRENRIVGTGWDRDRFEFDEKKVQVGRPVREWDVGKREELESEAERAREREKLRVGERGDRVSHSDRNDKEGIRSKERGDRERERKRRSSENDHRRSLSSSPARKAKKKNNDPPLRLLDDLFRKTKTTPCIYWLPLTPEQIAEKEAFRLRRIAEHQERVKQRELEKEKEREKERDRERERDKERRRERERSIGHRRSCSRDRRRY